MLGDPQYNTGTLADFNAGYAQAGGRLKPITRPANHPGALCAVAEADDRVGQGLKLVYAELQGVLTRNGVEAMEPGGEPLDPTVHEAISTRPGNGEAEPGTVVDVVEKGYKLDETVIRPARVVVAA